MNEEVVTTKIAANILSRSPRTLENWRSQKKGPPYIKCGGVLYRTADIDAWLEKGRVTTSECHD